MAIEVIPGHRPRFSAEQMAARQAALDKLADGGAADAAVLNEAIAACESIGDVAAAATLKVELARLAWRNR